MHLELNKIHAINCIDGLKHVAPKSVHTCVSSPPYYALRDYKLEPTAWPAISYKLFGFTVKVKAMSCCLGLEPSPEAFVGHLVYIYRLVRETLRDDGTVWLNIGDSYAANQKTRNDEQACRKSKLNGGYKSQIACKCQPKKVFPRIKPKDMLGIPWMLAFALREDGWYLRQDIIWHKLNCMPESCNDRCTKNHEYIFLLSKSKKYYFDQLAIATPIAASTAGDHRLKNESYSENRPESSFPGERADRGNGMLKPMMRSSRPEVDTRGGNQGNGYIPAISQAMNFKRDHHKNHEPIPGQNAVQHRPDREDTVPTGLANRRSVWSFSTQGFKEAHFATFPQLLPELCIKAGTSEFGCCAECGSPYRRVIDKEYKIHEKYFGDYQTVRHSHGKAGNSYKENIGIDHFGWAKTCRCRTTQISPCVVMDVFSGAGTVAMVALRLGRDFIAMEQSKKYVKMSEKRLRAEVSDLNQHKMFDGKLKTPVRFNNWAGAEGKGDAA